MKKSDFIGKPCWLRVLHPHQSSKGFDNGGFYIIDVIDDKFIISKDYGESFMVLLEDIIFTDRITQSIINGLNGDPQVL